MYVYNAFIVVVLLPRYQSKLDQLTGGGYVHLNVVGFPTFIDMYNVLSR